MIELKIKLYTLAELEPPAREKAIKEHRAFLLDTLRPDYIDGVTDWNDPEKMAMYREEYAYIEDNDDPVVESIEINDYLYFHNGTIVNAVTYTTGAAAGQTWVTIGGEQYRAEEMTPA